MKTAALFIIVASELLLAISAHSGDACIPKDSHVKALSYPNDIPGVLLEVLTNHVGEIAPPRGMFNPSDVIRKGIPDRRVMFVWNRGTRYVIASEHGGIGYNNPIFLYEVDQKNNTATLISEQIADSDAAICKLSNSLIMSK